MAGKKEIGISELALMLDITPEAVRKYETKGIVEVKRDEGNKYRKYSAWEIMAMLHARRFSQMGFTLSQAAGLLGTQDGRAHIESIEELQLKLAKEVARKRKLIVLLDQKKKERCSIGCQGNEIQIEHLDEMLYFELMQGDMLSDKMDQDARKEWIHALPFTSEYVIFNCDNEYSHQTGLAIRKSDAVMYGLQDLTVTRIIPENLCATCILKGDYDELIAERKLKETAECIEAKGYRIVGDIIAEIFDFAKVDGKYEVLHKCYFPIEI